jgi:sugar phosphate permease
VPSTGTNSPQARTETQAPSPRFGPKHRWVVLGVGVASQASFSAAITGLPVTAPTMRTAYHLSNSGVGFVLGCIYLGIAVSEIVWGLWTDKVGERRVLLIGLLSTALALALMAIFLVPSASSKIPFGLLAVSMLLIGVLGGSVNGSSGRAVMSWFRDGQRGLAMSIRQTAMPAGGSIGTLLLPWLARNHGFRPVYSILSLFCVAAAGAAWRWLHRPDGMSAAPSGAAGANTGVSPLRRGDVWRLAIASGMLTFPQLGVLTFAAIYLTDVKHAGLPAVVATLLVTQVGGAAARIGSGRWTDLHGNRLGMVRTIGVASGVVLIVAALLNSAPTAVVAATLALGGLLANAWHGVAYTEIAYMAGAERAGTALGLENTTVFGAAFLTPLIIPLVLGWSSWPIAWAVIGAIALLALPTTPRTRRAESPTTK